MPVIYPGVHIEHIYLYAYFSANMLQQRNIRVAQCFFFKEV